MDYTYPEDGGRKLLEIVFNYLPVDTALYARRCESSSTRLWDIQTSKDNYYR